MKSRFRCTLRGIPLGAVLALAPATAPGQTGVDLSDGIFRNSDWRSALIQSSGSPSFGAGQAVMPGDPDPNAPPGTPTAEYYREHRQSFSGLIAVGHFFAAGGYEPGQQDRSPILSLDYSFDLIQLSGEPMVFQLLLEQEGNYFAATTGESNDGNTNWTEHADTNLTASDFVNVGGAGPVSPDFSDTGGPIRFGYLTSNSSEGLSLSAVGGIDDWKVTLTVTPQADPVPADTSRFTIEPFADVSGPFHLSADGSGNIYVGRQEMSAGASVSIHKVTPEGKVTEFGDPIPDPDAVAVGPGGNVFVGGSTTEGTSHITRISPDGSTSVLVELENLEVLNNPQDMEFQGGDCYMPTSGPVRTTGPER